jgi:hypothetical protein
MLAGEGDEIGRLLAAPALNLVDLRCQLPPNAAHQLPYSRGGIPLNQTLSMGQVQRTA